MTITASLYPHQTVDNYYDISLLNALALQCHAYRLIELTQVADILPMFQQLREQNLAFVILANGSNVILPPRLEACVILPKLLGKTVLQQNDDSVVLEVMAGEDWHSLVVETVTKGWYGLENLALIPSSVGASPVQNIGAYGVQLDEVVESITALHIPTLQFHTLTNAECEFGYRDSRFKREVGDWLITQVTFKLHKQPTVTMNYGDVASMASDYAKQAGRTTVLPIDTMHAIIAIRQSKIPNTADLPNCGSFFKNPMVDKTTAETLLQRFPKLVHYPVKNAQGEPTDKVKLAAGWLIDQAGLKGQGIAPILTHVHQALVLTNHAPAQATQMDVEKSMNFIQATVKQKFGIWLEPEPVWIEADGSIRQTH